MFVPTCTPPYRTVVVYRTVEAWLLGHDLSLETVARTHTSPAGGLVVHRFNHVYRWTMLLNTMGRGFQCSLSCRAGSFCCAVGVPYYMRYIPLHTTGPITIRRALSERDPQEAQSEIWGETRTLGAVVVQLVWKTPFIS